MNSFEILIKIPMILLFPLFSTAVLFFFRTVLFWMPSRDKLLKKAIEDGHIVKAKLIKRHYSLKSRGEGGIYEYKCNGRTYKKRVPSSVSNKLRDEEEWYYVKNPKYATDEAHIGQWECSGIKWYCIISCALSVLSFL